MAHIGPMRIAGRLIALLLALGTTCARSPAATEDSRLPFAPAAVVTAPQLTLPESIILGLVEGVTEFLPVSSTGHLIVANHFLGLEDERQLTDAAGRPRWIKPPSAAEPAGRPLTTKAATNTFTVIIQIGGIAAVVVLYWSQLWSLALGMCGMDRNGAKLLRNVGLAVLPAAVFGLTLENWIDANLFSIKAVIGALVVGAVLMFVVDRWQRHSRWGQANTRQPHELRPSEALLVGGMQCLAMWPGTSRSMMTIVGGYCVGLKPVQAAEFSFLVGLPTLAGAALLKGYKSGPAMLEVFGWGPVLLGIFVAFVSGALAIKVLVAALTRFGLSPFAVYRLVLAGALCVVLAS
jgi:undecaprenyl-diphosphatase